MRLAKPSVTVDIIIAAVCRHGASAAGVLPMATLLETPSLSGQRHPNWPKWAASALVFGLDHPPDNLPLDYWGGKFGTLGNRHLIDIGDRMIDWLRADCGVRAHNLPYPPHAGGIFLKEAAVKAGLGVIGKNNLLVSPRFGPRLRLRALFLDLPVDMPLPEAGFDPCGSCDAPCLSHCPQEAFRDGRYTVERCRRQMRIDQRRREPATNENLGVAGKYLKQVCRVCELSCPLALITGGQTI